jgi:hypothetical protein
MLVFMNVFALDQSQNGRAPVNGPDVAGAIN